MKEYSFLQEWVGHAIAGTVGAVKGSQLGWKLGYKIDIHNYKKYLDLDPKNVISEAENLILQYQKSIKWFKEKIEAYKPYLSKESWMAAGYNEVDDEWDLNYVKMAKNAIKHYLEIIKQIEQDIKHLRKCIEAGNFEELKKILIQENGSFSALNTDHFRNNYRMMGNLGLAGFAVGGVGGGVGYHYAKKGIKAGIKKLLKK